VIVAVGGVLLWRIPISGPEGGATLRIRVIDTRQHIADKPNIYVYLKNASTVPFYITTNLDPFVGGQGMFRNYYLTLSGPRNAMESTRLFLGALVSLNEQQLLQTGIIALLEPGETYSGMLPVDAWSDLVREPGQYRISAGYRGTGTGAPLRYPLLDKHIESKAVTVEILN
jgi:hypothetical protein